MSDVIPEDDPVKCEDCKLMISGLVHETYYDVGDEYGPAFAGWVCPDCFEKRIANE